MTDPPGLPGDDIRRPLDESLPSELPRPAGPTPTPAARPDPPAAPVTSLRPAAPLPVPATGAIPATPATPATPAAASGPSAAAGADPAAGPDPAPEPVGGLRGARRTLATRLNRAALAGAEAPVRAARALTSFAGRPGGRFTMPALLIGGLLGVALSSGAFLVPTGGEPDPTAPPDPTAAPGLVAPTAPPAAAPPLNNPGSVPTGPGNPADTLAGWADQLQARTGIPAVALRAYGYAELAVGATTPGCRLSWTTLAAIGRVESNHGSSGGASLLPDGRALPPIFGLPLDGAGDRAQILDTDGGQLDQDPTYDRAVGPMQFIPSTWLLEAVDATGDGIGDVHNIFDASLAAANYLCRSGRDLTTAAGWWEAVLSYNAVQVYAEAVFAAANQYGLESRGG